MPVKGQSRQVDPKTTPNGLGDNGLELQPPPEKVVGVGRNDIPETWQVGLIVTAVRRKMSFPADWKHSSHCGGYEPRF